MDKIKYNLSRR